MSYFHKRSIISIAVGLGTGSGIPNIHQRGGNFKAPSQVLFYIKKIQLLKYWEIPDYFREPCIELQYIYPNIYSVSNQRILANPIFVNMKF